jgi:MFS family permease
MSKSFLLLFFKKEDLHFGSAHGNQRGIVFAAAAGLAGFFTYFAMYAFRKPFASATFADVPGWHFALDYKIALILAQVLGYALSKFIGVKVIAEIHASRRAAAIIGLIFLSWLALVGFALIPAPWNVLTMFLNGLPLGMIWGLVFGFMEGRRVSEVLASMMCASFIVSSGAVKSVGLWLIDSWHVSPFWMPAVIGLLFMPLLLVSVWVLSRLPPPDARDEIARVRRMPMSSRERAAFLADYGPGLFLIVFAYILLTAFRDYRDNFAAEIWAALGHGGQAAIFSASELPVAVIALVGMAAIIAIHDNCRALMVIHGMMAGGCAVLGLATLAFQWHVISPLMWMILAGTGLYVAYNPVNAVLFDRLVAVSGRTANAGFLIYVADSSGYMGSVVLLLWRNLVQASMNWLQFFIEGAYVTSVLGGLATTLAALYFYRRSAPEAAHTAMAKSRLYL